MSCLLLLNLQKFFVIFINSSKFHLNMKCELCKKGIEENFLKKPIGTYIKDAKGKLHLICNNCQKKYTKQEILTKF